MKAQTRDGDTVVEVARFRGYAETDTLVAALHFEGATDWTPREMHYDMSIDHDPTNVRATAVCAGPGKIHVELNDQPPVVLNLGEYLVRDGAGVLSTCTQAQYLERYYDLEPEE
jgi:hypothetical protein